MKESGTEKLPLAVENISNNQELERLKLPTLGSTYERLNGLKGEINSRTESSWPNESFFGEKNRIDPFIFTAKMDNAFSTQGKAAEVGDDGMTGSMSIEVSKGDTTCKVDYKLYTQRYNLNSNTNTDTLNKPKPLLFEKGEIQENNIGYGQDGKKFDPIKPWIPTSDKVEMGDENNLNQDLAGRIDVLKGGCVTQIFEYQGERFKTTLDIGLVTEIEGDFGGESFQNLIHGATGSGKLNLDYGEKQTRLGVTGELQFEKFSTGGITLYLNPGWEVYDDKTGKIYLSSKIEKRSGKLILDLTSIVGVRNISDNTVIKNAIKTGENYGALSTGVTYEASNNSNVTLRTGNNEFNSDNFYIQLLLTKEIF